MEHIQHLNWVESNTVDLAYITTSETITWKNPIKLRTYNAPTGASVYTLGYPKLNIWFSCGKIISYGSKHIYSSLYTVDGCSGSGID